MRRTIYPVFYVFFCLLALEIEAATLHLNSGESISGQIQKMDEQTLTLESDRGFGILQIDQADIRLIEFEGNQRDLSRKFGLGYHAKGNVGQAFTTSSASLKYWLNSTHAVDMLIGFEDTSDGKKKIKEIFNLEIRLTQVLFQEGNQDIYWGGGLGFLSVKDAATQTDDTGFNAHVLLGIEFFFVMFPNIGISAELGISNQAVGGRTSTGIFNTGFPSMSVHYYF